MYQNILITVVAATVVLWFLYDSVLARLFHKPEKMIAKFSGHAPTFYEVCGQIRSEFQKGNFQQVVILSDTLLNDTPFECSALSYKAYALYHSKKYSEAKEIFMLLDTLPNQDCTKMLKKINDILTA